MSAWTDWETFRDTLGDPRGGVKIQGGQKSKFPVGLISLGEHPSVLSSWHGNSNVTHGGILLSWAVSVSVCCVSPT